MAYSMLLTCIPAIDVGQRMEKTNEILLYLTHTVHREWPLLLKKKKKGKKCMKILV